MLWCRLLGRSSTWGPLCNKLELLLWCSNSAWSSTLDLRGSKLGQRTLWCSTERLLWCSNSVWSSTSGLRGSKLERRMLWCSKLGRSSTWGPLCNKLEQQLWCSSSIWSRTSGLRRNREI